MSKYSEAEVLCGFSEINFERKQRIYLSRYALSNLRNDMTQFGFDKIATILNLISLNFYDTADASILLRLKEYEQELKVELSENGIENSEKFLKFLLNRKKAELMEKLKALTSRAEGEPRGVSFTYRIDNTNVSGDQNHAGWMTNSKNNEYDESVYISLGKYLSAMFEEYARKPSFEREAIIKKEQLKTIEDAIDLKHRKMIRLSVGKSERNTETFDFKPYLIASDDLHTRHYIIGIRKSNNHMMSIRLASVIAAEIGNEFAFDPVELEMLQKELLEKGASYVGQPLVDVTVKFTSKGLKQLKSVETNRPNPKNYEKGETRPALPENVIVFHCTGNQANHYFKQFGKEAVVLNPDVGLRNFYKIALDQYDREDNA